MVNNAHSDLASGHDLKITFPKPRPKTSSSYNAKDKERMLLYRPQSGFVASMDPSAPCRYRMLHEQRQQKFNPNRKLIDTPMYEPLPKVKDHLDTTGMDQVQGEIKFKKTLQKIINLNSMLDSMVQEVRDHRRFVKVTPVLSSPSSPISNIDDFEAHLNPDALLHNVEDETDFDTVVSKLLDLAYKKLHRISQHYRRHHLDIETHFGNTCAKYAEIIREKSVALESLQFEYNTFVSLNGNASRSPIFSRRNSPSPDKLQILDDEGRLISDIQELVDMSTYEGPEKTDSRNAKITRTLAAILANERKVKLLIDCALFYILPSIVSASL
jgi:hypothetical protein